MRVVPVLGVFMLMIGSAACAQGTPWRIQNSDDETVTATVATAQTGRAGDLISTLLTLGFNKKTQCRQMEFGIAALQGSGYGEPIGKISPPRTEPISLDVDGRSIDTPLPFLVKYDNGYEAVFAATDEVTEAIMYGKVAIIQIVSGTPRFEFPISGAGVAIAEAQRKCLSSM
jgi:hypothetical protein